MRSLFDIPDVEIVSVFSKWSNQENVYLDAVHDFCGSNGIPVVDTSKNALSKAEFESAVMDRSDNVDFLLSCCYHRIFSPRLLEIPNVMAINVHPSFLPRYRGIKPLENAIVRSEPHVGVTLHQLTAELDAGDILLQDASIAVRSSDTYKYLYEKQCELIKQLLARFFTDPDRFIRAKKAQDPGLATLAPRLGIQIGDDDTVETIRKRFTESGAIEP